MKAQLREKDVNAPTVASVSATRVLAELRKRHFGVLATASVDGHPHAAGVNYGVSGPDHDLAIYVMTRRHLLKARNISHNPCVALVIPLRRWLLWFLPSATMQLSGRAEIIDGRDPLGMRVFEGFWMGRRILRAYDAARKRGETRICFLKITPDPVVVTYMVGANMLQLSRRMESGAGRVMLPVLSQSTPRS